MSDSQLVPALQAITTYVKLNVGGSLFATTVDTLTRQGSHMLSQMFTTQLAPKTDADGFVFIDRDGTYFRYILNYLRDGDIDLPASEAQIVAILREAQYYLIGGLVARIEALLRKTVQVEPKCFVPVITSEEEDAAYIASSKLGRPVVKLAYSRGNNKFSYTQPSDDALLKNIELFDKLSLKFNGRITFVKDVAGKSGHICTWMFFGHGKYWRNLSSCYLLGSFTQHQAA